jgi:hypothetical protein
MLVVVAMSLGLPELDWELEELQPVRDTAMQTAKLKALTFAQLIVAISCNPSEIRAYWGGVSFSLDEGCAEEFAAKSGLDAALKLVLDIEASSDCPYFGALTYPWLWSLLMSLITTSTG